MNSMKNFTVEDLKGIWKGKEFSLHVGVNGEDFDLSDIRTSPSKLVQHGRKITLEYDAQQNTQKIDLDGYEVELFQILNGGIVLIIEGKKYILKKIN